MFFSPRSDPNFEHKKEFIEFNLFKKLCDELKELSFIIFIFSGFIEPLLIKIFINLYHMQKKFYHK